MGNGAVHHTPTAPVLDSPRKLGEGGIERLRSACAPVHIRQFTQRSTKSGHRQLPLQSREPRIVAIESYPFAAPLDRERCEPGIGDA